MNTAYDIDLVTVYYYTCNLEINLPPIENGDDVYYYTCNLEMILAPCQKRQQIHYYMCNLEI